MLFTKHCKNKFPLQPFDFNFILSIFLNLSIFTNYKAKVSKGLFVVYHELQFSKELDEDLSSLCTSPPKFQFIYFVFIQLFLSTWILKPRVISQFSHLHNLSIHPPKLYHLQTTCRYLPLNMIS